MKTRRPTRFLQLLLSVILLLSHASSPQAVQSQHEGGITEFAPPVQQSVVTPLRGLEKLSPDLQMALGRDLPIRLASAQSAQTFLVSVVVQPGVDVQRYFIQSARSRPVAGYQWVNGEMTASSLRKIASMPGVLGIFSTHTYQTAPAPGLEDLRRQYPHLEVEEARELLEKGGPDLLRQRLEQENVPELRYESPQRKNPSMAPALAASAAPDLLDVNDFRSAWDAGFKGKDVVVAVVDTGVDFSHPDLQGTQAIISQGPYTGWAFSYDVLSGLRYAMDTKNVLDPRNVWSMMGATQYVRTLPIVEKDCNLVSCSGWLQLGREEENQTRVMVHASWPDKSKSGNYYFTVHPDFLLFTALYYLNINYPGGWAPPVIIVADENEPGKYDTAYVDMNLNGVLEVENERLTKSKPVGGADLTGDGVWDLSAGMLTWISDGEHHPPGVTMLYPEVAEIAPPAPGELLAFVSDWSGHGTNCASQIAAQGKITDPQGLGPTNPQYAGALNIGGVGTPVIQGVAPETKIAAFQNGFQLPLDAWTLAIMGMGGELHPGNGAQIVSNSWGDSATIEDGWDAVSRFAQQLSYEVAPEASFVVATGNGGHGYGTVTSPSGASILGVGASTAYGSLKVFESVTPEQFLYGNVQPWSNRGPGVLGDIAPDVVAVGAWGTGAQPLNYYFGNGQAAYDVFGGTSMSTPVAAGALSVIYQSFRSQPQNQRWPTWEEARMILLNGAQDLGYDVFTQGAGDVQAGRSVKIAVGQSPWVEPQQWMPGNYRDQRYPAFPALLHPGEQDEQQFTVHNPTAEDITFQIAENYLVKQYEETYTMPYAPPAPSSSYKLPVFLENITGLIEEYDPALVRVQVNFPFQSFDINGDNYADAWWEAYFYDWMDRNQDMNLWVDKNRNGMVDNDEIDIDSETGNYEFNRFTFAYPQSTRFEAYLGAQAIAQAHDGIFLGLGCRYCGESVTLQVRLTFYEKSDWNWLSLSADSISVPAGGQAAFMATVASYNAPPGVYEGAIELHSSGGNITIPLVALLSMNSETFQFGGAADQEALYNNAEINGGFNWNWRYESGDWRFFFYDIAPGAQQPGKSLVVETRWDVPKTDVDTWVLGKPQEQTATLPTSIFGPQEIGVIGGSEDTYQVNGKFAWKTHTGTPRELVGAPYQEGLGVIALHNVLSGGGQPVETITGSVFQVTTAPAQAAIDVLPDTAQTPYLAGSQTFSILSTGAIPEGIQLRAYGFNIPEPITNQVIRQNNPGNICSASWVYRETNKGLKISHGGLLEITSSSANPELDLDVYLFRDNGDRIWNCSREVVVSYSMNYGPDEDIKIYFPEDGTYWIAVHGYHVPQDHEQFFDLNIRAIYGTELKLHNLPSGPVQAGQPVEVGISFQSLYQSAVPSTLEGLLLVGPPAVPTLLEVPIRLNPTILIFPAPMLSTRSSWVQQSPQQFHLSFQNQGTQVEDVQAQIFLPQGLEYRSGSAQGPGSVPHYDPDARTLSWTGEVAARESVDITFQAAAQQGYPEGIVTLQARVVGLRSAQEWNVTLNVWLNRYGLVLPYISR